MSIVSTIFRTDAHVYTRSKTPWIIGEHPSAYGKLIHYLSGGGMRTFGRTIAQEESRRKHVRFYVFAGILGVVYSAFYFL